MDRHVFFATERSADRPIDDPNAILRQTEYVGDLLPVLRCPLAPDLDRDPALVVEVGRSGLGLKVRVLLVRNLIGAVDHDIGDRPSKLDISLANAKVVVGVRVEPILGMQKRSVGGEGGVDVGDDGEVFPLDLERCGAVAGACVSAITTAI